MLHSSGYDPRPGDDGCVACAAGSYRSAIMGLCGVCPAGTFSQEAAVSDLMVWTVLAAHHFQQLPEALELRMLNGAPASCALQRASFHISKCSAAGLHHMVLQLLTLGFTSYLSCCSVYPVNTIRWRVCHVPLVPTVARLELLLAPLAQMEPLPTLLACQTAICVQQTKRPSLTNLAAR
jgi:hypothetical protein